MSHRPDRDPSGASQATDPPVGSDDGTPREPDDTTAGGDAKSGAGEDNHGAKKGEQSAEDFIRR